MKALRSHAIGGPETLTLDELDSPVPGPGQVRITVKACSINYPDVLIIKDMYQFKPARPFAPGGELAGIVDAVGEGVTQWKAGDRVIAMMGNGGLATEVLADAARLFALPEGVSFETGASLLMTYGTNMHGLLDRGHLKAGDTLLVLGAAGGEVAPHLAPAPMSFGVIDGDKQGRAGAHGAKRGHDGRFQRNTVQIRRDGPNARQRVHTLSSISKRMKSAL